MNKLRSCFLHVLGFYVLFPLWRLGFRVAAKGRGLRRLRVGKLSVWGDSGFLDLCKSSIERLKTLDSGLYQALTSTRRTWVVQDSQRIGDAAPMLFGINPSYVAWQSNGVIARLVYVTFCISGFSQRQNSVEEGRAMYQKVLKNSRSWLEAQGFPQELVDCYPDVEDKPDAAEQSAPPNSGPVMPLANSGVPEGPPSVS